MGSGHTWKSERTGIAALQFKNEIEEKAPPVAGYQSDYPSATKGGALEAKVRDLAVTPQVCLAEFEVWFSLFPLGGGIWEVISLPVET